ncbi:tetratricopeptide repeat protein [Streptomyces triticiradicis]|uniref:non-specific serine/threonine protein kinase n=1 Tax=Streptomyces triticiradicis TaxID=2651189 RepID=A0A7J5D5F4_9ACTN|nr:tetratricopeptide repeat protein [Streptomyces triticiradicis]KAB1979566.1 protein kinase [Streptomyces triticiradicis]
MGTGPRTCDRPDCGRGTIDEQGFCDVCDRQPQARDATAPAPRTPEPGPAPDPAPSARVGTGLGVAQVRPDPWYGLGLVDPHQVPRAADVPPVAPGPVAEAHRFCPGPSCGRPVGRGHEGEPGRTAGFCPYCGTRFDFAQPDGLTIAGRYDVTRVLGSGAYGAAYLAHDRNLATDVVLKALHRTVARTARHERDVLVGLRHDSIVRILGYEQEGPHLVLEYVPGEPLSARDGDRLETLLAHGVRVLQALDYLHARGLLHCDVKPLNIIRFGEESPTGALDRVRLIDFGAVRNHTKDTGPVVAYTRAYAPPETDPEHRRPTPGFDLYGLGMTLREVCRSRWTDSSAPGADSLRLLLERATDPERPWYRFVSARQFAEQLSGVIRQVVAAPPTRRQVARPSALFGSVPEPLHGGLGTARPLAHWVGARAEENALLKMPGPFLSPAPGEVAATLPAPLSDPDDPRVTGSADGALAESRLALRRRDAASAARRLAAAGLPDWHWLPDWYRGLIALAEGSPERAAVAFTRVRRALPGELVPHLALGLCAELRGDRAVARSHYGTVFDTTPALGAAGFGLARVLLLDGERARAVDVAEQLAKEFRYEREARVAAVRLRVMVLSEPGHPAPTEDDVARAGECLPGLDVDEAAAAALRAEIQYARFLHTHDRLELSGAVRALGPHAPTEREYVALVDLANRLRPAPGWGRQGKRGRTSRSRSGAAPGGLGS